MRKKGEKEKKKRGDYRGDNNREFEGKKKRGRKGRKEEEEKREEEREEQQNSKNRLNKSLSRI